MSLAKQKKYKIGLDQKSWSSCSHSSKGVEALLQQNIKYKKIKNKNKK
jgi:hypothetical protein